MGIKRAAGALIPTLIFLALALGLILGAGRLRHDTAGLSVRFADTAVPEKTLEKLAEDADTPRLTAAWSRSGKTAATASDLGTAAALRCVTAYGDMREVCALRLLAGSYPLQDDETGCLLSAEAAMTLFHSVDAVGARLRCAGREYTVRGVAASYEPLVIVRRAGAAYENLEFAAEDLSGAGTRVKAALYRCGLTDDYVLVESGLYARILYALACMPLALALLRGAWRLLAAAWRHKKSAGALLLRLLPALAALALLIALLRHSFYWPQSFLPTRCSDFAFWGERLTLWRETWRSITLMLPLPKDIQFFQAARRLLCASAALLTLSCLPRRVLLPDKTRR